jgi:uncharacterized protein (TIGR02001 family)
MKKTTLALAMGLMISGAANAALEANIGATSNYMWRGVTQTDNEMAISGGLDYVNESGLYAGIWVSNATWGGADMETEMDLYAGFSTDDYDIGVIKYMYPSDNADNDFTEIYGSLTISGVTAGAAYDPDNENLYYHLGTEMAVAEDLGLSATLGRYDFDGAGDYTHLTLDLSKGDFTFSLSKATSGSGDDSVIPYVSYSKSF